MGYLLKLIGQYFGVEEWIEKRKAAKAREKQEAEDKAQLKAKYKEEAERRAEEKAKGFDRLGKPINPQ